MDRPEKVALVCDWLTEVGGGERVIKAVHEMYPDAPIYTSQYRPKRAPWFDEADVRTGWLNRLPVGLKRFIPFLRQFYFSRLDLSEYDLVISITGAEAKSVKTRADALHVSYIHAPTQYYWTLYNQYLDNPGFGILNPVVRLGLKLLVKPLRKADYKAAQNPDVIVVPSNYIKDEVEKHYNRQSEVIWPNVDVAGIRAIVAEQGEMTREGFITYGRQVSWKRIDIAVQAAIQTGEKLVVIGDGPEHETLVKLAANASNITFLPRYDGIQEIVSHIRSAKAFLFPSVEPFGIAPVEALACGTPLIALRKAGALDMVIEGENGVFFGEQTVQSMVDAMQQFATMPIDEQRVTVSAERFSEENFTRHLSELIASRLNG